MIGGNNFVRRLANKNHDARTRRRTWRWQSEQDETILREATKPNAAARSRPWRLEGHERIQRTRFEYGRNVQHKTSGGIAWKGTRAEKQYGSHVVQRDVEGLKNVRLFLSNWGRSR